MDGEWVTLRVYISDMQADRARMALDASGIPVRIRKDDCGGWVPYLHVATGVRLMVPPGEVDRANEILQDTGTT